MAVFMSADVHRSHGDRCCRCSAADRSIASLSHSQRKHACGRTSASLWQSLLRCLRRHRSVAECSVWIAGGRLGGFNPLVIFKPSQLFAQVTPQGGGGQVKPPNSPCSLHIVVMLNPFSVNPEYSSHSFRNLAQLTQIPVLVWAYEHTRRHFV